MRLTHMIVKTTLLSSPPLDGVARILTATRFSNSKRSVMVHPVQVVPHNYTIEVGNSNLERTIRLDEIETIISAFEAEMHNGHREVCGDITVTIMQRDALEMLHREVRNFHILSATSFLPLLEYLRHLKDTSCQNAIARPRHTAA